MTDLSGREIGGYRLVSVIGAGGMGEVYRAHDPVLGRDVAIKVVPPALAASTERMARFEREARLLAALNHPHVAAIYGIVESDGIRGLVLELVEGQTLTAHIALGLSINEALRIGSEIADALDAAHERGIVHRDLKPDNIRITPEGSVKVLDFGIAKMAAGEASGDLSATTVVDTIDGVLIGTAPFMSPEQARGKAVDKRTDVWAFGCVLYQMLTGRRAFAGPTATDAIAAILERDPDWSALPPSTPPSVRRLLRRCLEKDARRRLRDIGDARADLDDARSGALDGDRQPVRQRNLVPWIISAALFAAVFVLVWLGRPRDEAARTGAPMLARTVRLTNTPEREFGPAISPDGTWIAYYSDARGSTDILVKYLDSGATLNLTKSLDVRLPSRTNLGGLAISPDGKNLAFFGMQDLKEPIYDTWVLPAPLGGFPRRLLQGMQGAQWSPDGQSLACILPGSSLGDALIVAGADGSNPKQLVRAENGVHIHWPTWAADGRSIYFIRTYQPWNIEQSEIYRVALGGGSPEPVVRSIRRAVYPVPLPGGDLIFSANPDSVDLGLWWQSAGGGDARRLSAGLGEYAEARVSRDGRRLVSMVLEMRQSLVSLNVSDGAPVVRPLTDGYGGDIDPSFDPKGDRLVFSSTRSGYRNLWTSRQDGSDARPLTSDAANDHHPAFSPDGRQIAFVSDRGGHWGIWLMSADGGAARPLTKTIVLDSLTWSRDGTQIVYSTPGTDRPTILSSVAVATGETRVFQTPAAAVAPSWSPTADAIAYLEPTMEAQADPTAVPISRIFLTVADTQGRSLYPELRSQRLTNGLVSWAPDGRRIAVATVPANAPAVVWIVEPGARAPFRKLTELKPSVRPRGITWTTNGEHIILAAQESVSDLVLHEIDR